MNPSLSLLEDLFRQIIGPFVATQISALMVEPDNIDERVILLAETFARFPHFIPPFHALVKSMHADQSGTSIEEQIRFYNTKHTRNWLIVNLFNQVLNIKELKLDESNGRLPGKPADLLKYANQSRVVFGEESRYKDLVYAGGLLYDFMFYVQRSSFVNLGQSKFDEPINQAFTDSVEQSKIILKLAKNKSKLTLEKFTPLTAYLRNLAPIAISILRPNSAPDFYKKLATLKHTESVRLAMEMGTFGVHTGMISAYLAQSLSLFEELGEAMSVWGFPFLSWVSGSREIHDLSGLGLLGVTLNERLKPADFPGAGKVGLIVPELTYLDIEINTGGEK